MTRAEFVTCMAVLETGCNVPLPATTVETWYSILGDLPVEALEASVIRVLAERTYPGLPAVGHLRVAATEWLHGQIASPEAAYARLREGMSRFGMPITEEENEQLKQFLGKSIWGIVQGLGGWPRLCDSPPGQRGVIFAQFRDAWQRLADRRRTQSNLPAAAKPSITMDPRALQVARKLNVPRIGVEK